MQKVFSYLGLAKRAGKLILGTDAVIKNLNKGKTKLIFVASDASNATIDKVERKGFFYKIPVIKKYSTTELSNALGTLNSKVVGLNDIGFTKAILVELERIGE